MEHWKLNTAIVCVGAQCLYHIEHIFLKYPEQVVVLIDPTSFFRNIRLEFGDNFRFSGWLTSLILARITPNQISDNATSKILQCHPVKTWYSAQQEQDKGIDRCKFNDLSQ
ncbi:hypothetical protein QYM36_001364 [Artemia franciscana]|uniref:Uncharacterized protein n=1 Tax=Artemia franciscana TaxID=6661 RepID=A0AA88IAQ9_ARTSF|nr:hypothetical protein QYM36_001364 [Artemia franciscana]